MFDFAWSELALIGVVALVAIGPKDMPVAIKAMAGMVRKARRMAGEFQGHLDELMREADLGDVRNSLGGLRGFNLRGQIERAIDPDGTLRQTIHAPVVPPAEAEPVQDEATFVGVRHTHSIGDPGMMGGMGGMGGLPGLPVPPPDHLRPDPEAAPAQIPPMAVARERALRTAPAFIPPEHADLAGGN